MPKVIINRVSREMLSAYAADNDAFISDATELPDGRFEISVDADVLAGLALVDPDLDKAIARACSDLLKGRK